jgi:hypothetical protein
MSVLTVSSLPTIFLSTSPLPTISRRRRVSLASLVPLSSLVHLRRFWIRSALATLRCNFSSPLSTCLHPYSLTRPFDRSCYVPAIQLSEVKTADIQPYVSLEAINRAEFGGVGALELNNITELDVLEPEFLAAFRAKLKQHRWIARETVNLFFITCGSSY